ncbi:unnamed protein product [Acanthosepion pharaonis]|uniref:Cadherin domain-containing protein n=1 Tax=Acanthosepion pharaonis TaxID=158019 RepID=A0A812BJY7_ACAPH|nr:unnamed protein product [Sepia pharaonis]
MDINDVQPQFFKETYTFRIYENQQSNFPVGFINATDPDLGSGGQLTYSLLTDNKHFLPFQIRDDGFISTIMSLDHEFKDVYEFQVLVKDKGTPSLNNTVNVVVDIRDENDNAPYFTFPSVNPFTMNILYYPHYTKEITVLKASDSDSRENAFLKYEITSGNDKQLFTINHYTGSLSFTRVVTQQDAGSYGLEFVVKDSGNPVLSAATVLTLSLTVSNKTSEMTNAVHMKTEDKIHLNLAVVIVLVAVSVSVITTAFISICIIRCNERQNALQKEEVNPFHRCVSEQRHLMCPSYHGDSWADVPVAIATDSDKVKDAHLRGARTESHPADDSCDGLKNLPAALNPWTSIEKLRQVSAFVYFTPWTYP